MSNRSEKINSILSKKNFERTDFPMVPEVTRGYQTTEIQKAFKGNEIANDIVESLKRKTVMKDIEKNRILALSDDHVTELDEKDIRIIANRALAQVNEFVTLVANKGWNKNYVKSILVMSLLNSRKTSPLSNLGLQPPQNLTPPFINNLCHYYKF